MAKKKDVHKGADFGASHGPVPGSATGNEFNREKSKSFRGKGMFSVAGSNWEVPIEGGDNEMDAGIKRELGKGGKI